MNESFIKISRTCVKSQADPGLELQKALAEALAVHMKFSIESPLSSYEGKPQSKQCYRELIRLENYALIYLR